MVNLKKQTQNRPLAGNSKHETRNPKRVEKVHLKKQTQFLKGQNDVKSVLTMDYGEFDGPGQRENKAKQSQFCRSVFGVQSSAAR